MEKEQYSVDELFRMVLKDQEMPPPADAWYNIQKALDSKKRFRFMWTLRALAATFALLLTFAGGYFIASYKNHFVFSDNKPPVQGPGIPVQSKPAAKQIFENSAIVTSKQGSSGTSYITKRKTNLLAASAFTIDSTKSFSSKKEIVSLILQEDSRLTYLAPIQINMTVGAKNQPGVSALEFQSDWTNVLMGEEIVLDENDSGDVTKGSSARWSLGGQVSPLYAFRETTTAGASMGVSQLASYSAPKESGILSYSGGMNVEYKASKRLSVSSGLYYSRMGQNINGNAYGGMYTQLSSVSDNLVGFQNSTGKLIKSNSNFVSSTNSMISSGSSANLLQSMDFLELPLMLRYKLIDRKVGFHILGGISTSVLVANKLVLEDPSGIQDYGTTSGLTTFNYSGTLGLGLDYSLSKKIQLNLEPAFKYYLNSINSSGNIESHPYSFGIYTGMRYTF